MNRLTVRGDVGGLSVVIWPLLTEQVSDTHKSQSMARSCRPGLSPSSPPHSAPPGCLAAANQRAALAAAVHAFILSGGTGRLASAPRTLSQRPHSHKGHTLTLCPIVLGLRRNRIRQRSRSRSRKSNPVRPSQPATQKFHFSHTERALASHHPLSAFCNNHGAQSRQRTAPSPPKPSHDKAGVSHVCGTGCSRRLSSHLVISPAVLAM